MPDATTKYALASPNVVHETFEDEVVVVSLDSGSYYSLEGSATECWNLALAGFSEDDIVDSLCAAYQVERSLVETSVNRFMSDTVQEGLLIINSHSHSNSQPSVNDRKARSPIVSEAKSASFSPPVLTRYDEMRQLLLIDPVHMVGDAGWPELPADQANNDDG